MPAQLDYDVHSEDGTRVVVPNDRLVEISKHLTYENKTITNEIASIAAELLELRKQSLHRIEKMA